MSTMSFKGNTQEFVQLGNCTGIQVSRGEDGIQPTSASLPVPTPLTYLESTAALLVERRVKHDLIKRFSGKGG
jgi:hypothetical protein